MSWFTKLFASDRSQARPRPFRPQLESLEHRLVPTVTFHGGNVLSHVEVEGLYYGKNWSTNPTLFQQTGQFEGFLQNIVNSPYMDMLSNAGYKVGRGSSSGGKIYNATPGSTMTDSDIRSGIQNAIKNANPLAAPDANRLYVVYIEPNVEVINDHSYNSQKGRYENSVSDFGGYHSAFTGTDAQGHTHAIRYAVVTTPGGTVHNAYAAGESYLSTFNEMTMVTSHELAEAVTDPDVNYSTLGWYDNQKKGEIGDLANGQSVYLNGYLVQKEVDQYDNVITPTHLTFSTGNFQVARGTTFTAQLAAGTDSTGLTNFNNLMAFVYWGDGSYGYASVTSDGHGHFLVQGTHKYTSAGKFTVTVSVWDKTNSVAGAYGTETATSR